MGLHRCLHSSVFLGFVCAKHMPTPCCYTDWTVRTEWVNTSPRVLWKLDNFKIARDSTLRTPTGYSRMVRMPIMRSTARSVAWNIIYIPVNMLWSLSVCMHNTAIWDETFLCFVVLQFSYSFYCTMHVVIFLQRAGAMLRAVFAIVFLSVRPSHAAVLCQNEWT